MNKKKTALWNSAVALLLCVSMLLGTTYAWFTDSVVSTANVISTGTLKVGLYHTNSAGADHTPVTNETKDLFQVDLWEPGVAAYENFTIKNEGSLWLQYQLGLNALDVNYVQRGGSQFGLSQALVAGVVKGGISDSNNDGTITREEAIGQIIDWVPLSTVLEKGFLAPEGKEDVVSGSIVTDTTAYGVVIYWKPTGNDNNWNVNNGANTSDGQPLTVDLGVTLAATQYNKEADSFGPDYDKGAQFPELNLPVKVTVAVPSENGVTTEEVTMQGRDVTATVPAGVQLKDGEQTLTLTVTEMEQSNANITTGENDDMVSLDVHIDGVAEGNTTPILVDLGPVMPKYLSMGNYRLYHVENGVTTQMTCVSDLSELDTHNEFFYDQNTGNLTVAMATFSEVLMVADVVNPWNGKYDYSWYNADAKALNITNADQLAGLSAIVGGMDGQTRDSFAGKTVKLIADINLGDKESENNPNLIFYPIGYYNNEGTYEKTNTAITSGFKTFEGTFDGQGHTIANFYQNTWEMKGDNEYYDAKEQYYRDGMGLFGKVYGGTVKNLTVDNFSSDGEYTTTGVIAAYADSANGKPAVFENIAITNCNPRVYNIGNGGIVGCGGWYSKDDTTITNAPITFKNITVDNSNKISALWGSYDVACGGLMGQYYPNSGCGVSFENCHVSAQIDVYNDVCGNYQYYAYRYAGMMIGSIRENETIDGHVYPKMDGIKATGCTVNFGTWNDYYYCELVDNTTASYTHDHQMSRLVEVKAINGTNITYLDGIIGTVPASGRANYVIVDYTKGHGTENATCYHFLNGEVWTHDMGGIQAGIDENGDGQDDLKEDKQHIYLEFNNLFTGYGWGVTSKGLTDFAGVTHMDITPGNQEKSVEKFATKFTGDFLYRVGNQGTVSLGTLFAAASMKDENGNELKDDSGNIKYHSINSSAVMVSIDKVDEAMNVGGTFSANTTDWTKGTIQFSGTGVVKVTIQDYNFCTPTELLLEVVDAVNATTATSATGNNVVLLKDCGFGSLEVSGGYALYGNGFTMTCSSDSVALDMGYAFVTLNNGTLDNVQIICPNFDYAVLYKSNMTESGNRKETDSSGKTRYYNVKSGVMVSGNSQILNSRISGARAAVNVSNGNVVIDNSHIELGAVASILVGAANSLTLRDVTLVQEPTASTYNSTKKLMGFSVLFVCDANGDAAPVTLEGTLVQNAWVDEDDKQYVPSAGQSIVSTVMAETDYLHDIDGNGKNESLNLGFAYMPESLTSKVNATTITDNRTNKSAVPYDYAEVSILNGKTYVYSYKNTNGTGDSFKEESVYEPNKNSDIIAVTYSDTADGLTTDKSYGSDGWVYELNVDLDKVPGYAMDFSKLSMSVNGITVADFKVNGNAKPTTPVAVTAGGTTYTLTATVAGKEYTASYKVTGTETSKESPSLVASNYEAGLCVASSYGGTWHGAAPVLEGIKIRYWSVAENQYKTIELSDYTPEKTGKQNGTNNYWTYIENENDFTLTVTNNTYVQSSKQVYAMPVVCNGNLYFVPSSTNGLVNSGNSARTIAIKYEFKDNNNGTPLTFSHTWSVEEKQGDENKEYKYSDFCNGTLTLLESSGGSSTGTCLAKGTLITMEDGSKRAVEDLRKGDRVMAFDHLTGEITANEVIIVVRTSSDFFYRNTFVFDDGTELVTINEHGIYDLDLNKCVNIDHENAGDYIGHSFVSVTAVGETGTKKLVNVISEYDSGYKYDIVTDQTLNYVAEDTLSVTHVLVDVINSFDFAADMTYDKAKMAADIETYGLYTYDEWEGYCDISVFEQYNIPVMKVGISKGLYTKEYIIGLINTYVLDESVQIID